MAPRAVRFACIAFYQPRVLGACNMLVSRSIHRLRWAAPLLGWLAMISTGCRDDALRRPSEDTAPPPAGLSPKQAAMVLAQVGDHSITLGEYAATLEQMDQFDRLRFKTPERRRELLDEMITVELLAKEAERRGLDKDPRTQEALRQVLRDALLRDARKSARAPGEFGEDEVKAYYEAHRDQYAEPERRRVSHLVVKDKKKAEELLVKAKAMTDQEKWGQLVLDHSDEYKGKEYRGPVETAGDLGLVGPTGDRRGANPRVDDSLRAAVFEVAEVGQMVDRVVPDASGSFHLVRLVGLTKAHTRSFAEAERTIRITLAQQEIAVREQQLEEELRKKYPVTIDEAALADVKMPTTPSAAPPPSDDQNDDDDHGHAH